MGRSGRARKEREKDFYQIKRTCWCSWFCLDALRLKKKTTKKWGGGDRERGTMRCTASGMTRLDDTFFFFFFFFLAFAIRFSSCSTPPRLFRLTSERDKCRFVLKRHQFPLLFCLIFSSQRFRDSRRNGGGGESNRNGIDSMNWPETLAFLFDWFVFECRVDVQDLMLMAHC